MPEADWVLCAGYPPQGRVQESARAAQDPLICRGISWGSAISLGSLWAQGHVVTYTASHFYIPHGPTVGLEGGSPRVGSMA